MIMENKKMWIAGEALPNLPWQERPEGSREVMWRYDSNPIIGRYALSSSNSIFNSAVVPFKKGEYNFAGVFRCDDTNRRMVLHVGFSKDGVNWNINEEPLRFECDNKEIGQWVYGYDPRVCFIEDRYYVTWCNGYYGPTIGVAWTTDFKTFRPLGHFNEGTMFATNFDQPKHGAVVHITEKEAKRLEKKYKTNKH